MFCPKCGAQVDSNLSFCQNCGASMHAANQFPGNNPTMGNYPMNNRSMGWFKFLIYFGLFAGAVLNALNGFQIMTGAHYDGYKEFVYAVFEGLETLDLIIGVGLIALAGLGIYTRFRLAGYHKNGPQMLTYTYLGALILNLGYIVGLFAVVPDIAESLDLSSTISSSIVSVVMIFVNKAYFGKRADLFIND